jgi:hypothetical protein
MGRATLDVIVPRLERRDGACPKTGLVHASLTRIGPIKALGQSEPLSKADSPAITVPEPMDRMDENAERRGKHLVPLLRPTLKGKIGWAAEGIERRPAEPASQAINQPPRPSIEGMFLAVSGEAAKCGHWVPPVQPSSTSVPTLAPLSSGGTPSLTAG